MQANPEKFHAITVGKNIYDKNPIFNIGDANISCDEIVKLLGVDIDFKLNFDSAETIINDAFSYSENV
jgi:hypothetical protein